MSSRRGLEGGSVRESSTLTTADARFGVGGGRGGERKGTDALCMQRAT